MDRYTQLLCDHLTQNHIHFESSSDNRLVWFYDQQGCVQSRTCVDIAGGTMSLQMLLPVPVRRTRKTELVRLMNAINWSTRVGCFCLDTENGHVCFRMTTELEEENAPAEVIAALFDRLRSAGMSFTGHFLPAVLAVATTSQTARRALAVLEAHRQTAEPAISPDLLQLADEAIN